MSCIAAVVVRAGNDCINARNSYLHRACQANQGRTETLRRGELGGKGREGRREGRLLCSHQERLVEVEGPLRLRAAIPVAALLVADPAFAVRASCCSHPVREWDLADHGCGRVRVRVF